MIGSFLLESITTGMYGERKNAIREYVQNSFDGIETAIETGLLRKGGGKITMTLQAKPRNLVIKDDGSGLSHRIAVNTLTAVGASRKKLGKQAGFRGIGRLAGIAFCNILSFRTKAANEELETLVTFDCEALREGMLRSGGKSAADLISACASYIQYPAEDTEDHFFEVSLLDMTNPPAEAVDSHQLKMFLSQVAPVDFHPEFRDFSTSVFNDVAELGIPTHDEGGLEEADEADDAMDDDGLIADWSVLADDADDLLERIPVHHVAIVVKTGDDGREERVYKPYRPRLGVDDSDDIPIKSIHVEHSKYGAWWGWIAHKDKPGIYDLDTVGGIRFRLKNIQIDGSDLITLAPSDNKVRDSFTRLSKWFMGEIHLDPRAVVPNARRDNFEEDPRWLAIRKEITIVCAKLTTEARKVSSDYQSSIEEIDRKALKIQNDFITITRAKTFSIPKAKKLLEDSDKLQRLVEKASLGAPPQEQLWLKTASKELAQVKKGLLERPKSTEFDQFRSVLLHEFMDKTFAILNDYLDIQLVEEIQEEMEKTIR